MLRLDLKDFHVGPRGACGSWLRVPVAAKGITTGRLRVKGRRPLTTTTDPKSEYEVSQNTGGA